ncbi:MAG: vitamin K epoxide reductase family protein [Chloroflexota bacterium]|nr:vitamin K epoxide reductase family protein [Chloroflexota bacterium]
MMAQTRNWQDWLELILIFAGIAVATYLTYIKLFGLEAYCAGVGNCEAVQTSPYAELFGIPVAILGLLTYLALLVLFLVKWFDWRDLGQLATQLFFLVTLVGLLFSVYLTYLELFVILAICPWCVASALVMLGLFFLALADVLGGEPEYAVESVPGEAGHRR